MPVEINKDRPKENKHWLSYQSLLKQGRQPQSLAFGRDLNAGGKVKNFIVKK